MISFSIPCYIILKKATLWRDLPNVIAINFLLNTCRVINAFQNAFYAVFRINIHYTDGFAQNYKFS